MTFNRLVSVDLWRNRARRQTDRISRIISQCSETISNEFNFKNARTAQKRDPFGSQKNSFASPLTVIDVGGCHGQFAREAISCFPLAEIYSFEPIPECFAELQLLAKQHEQIHPMGIALSDRSGFEEFNVSEFRDSSSFQPMRPEHLEAWPHTINKERILVEKAKLDDLINPQSLRSPIFVKIDVQGHEMFVIRGGRNVISHSHRVMIECNFVSLYEGQPSFDEIYREIKDMGFLFDGMINQLHHPVTGELMSSDLIFYKL